MDTNLTPTKLSRLFWEWTQDIMYVRQHSTTELYSPACLQLGSVTTHRTGQPPSLCCAFSFFRMGNAPEYCNVNERLVSLYLITVMYVTAMLGKWLAPSLSPSSKLHKLSSFSCFVLGNLSLVQGHLFCRSVVQLAIFLH